MLQGEADLTQVHKGTAVAAQSLIQFIVQHFGGQVYVVGNGHYNRLPLMGPSAINIHPATVQRFESDRKSFLQDKSKEHGCEGFIPITSEALEDITEMGMAVVAVGFQCDNIFYAEQGKQLKIYK